MPAQTKSKGKLKGKGGPGCFGKFRNMFGVGQKPAKKVASRNQRPYPRPAPKPVAAAPSKGFFQAALDAITPSKTADPPPPPPNYTVKRKSKDDSKKSKSFDSYSSSFSTSSSSSSDKFRSRYANPFTGGPRVIRLRDPCDPCNPCPYPPPCGPCRPPYPFGPCRPPYPPPPCYPPPYPPPCGPPWAGCRPPAPSYCRYPPPPCFPPPPPCPPPCIPPPMHGGRTIFRVPRGRLPPFISGMGQGFPCYNNCNFYTVPGGQFCPPPFLQHGGSHRSSSCPNPCIMPPPLPPHMQNPFCGPSGDTPAAKLCRKMCNSISSPSLSDSDFLHHLETLAESSTHKVSVKK